jgi:hypothetical protein
VEQAIGGDIGVKIEELKPAIEFTFDAGYQTRYYLLGRNVILAAGNKIPQSLTGQLAKTLGISNLDREVSASDTGMYYGGVAANWNGFSAGVRYIRGTSTIESQFSALSTLAKVANDQFGTSFPTDYSPVFKNYEEYVFDVNYSANLLPEGLLSGTVGYQPIVYPEATFFNTDRQDRMYATLGNSTFAFARPSATYNHLSQATPLTSGTLLPGARLFDVDILTFQIDGEIPLVTLGAVDVHGAYYTQLGLNSDRDFGKDYYQLGVSFPIHYQNLVITPHWNYNHRYDSGFTTVADNEQFAGINCRVNF